MKKNKDQRKKKTQRRRGKTNQNRFKGKKPRKPKKSKKSKKLRKPKQSKRTKKQLKSGVLGIPDLGIVKAIHSVGDPKSILWDLLLYFVEGKTWPRPFEWNSTLKKNNKKYILVDEKNQKITYDEKLDENHKQLWEKINRSKNSRIKTEFGDKNKIHLPELWRTLMEEAIRKFIESSFHSASKKEDDIQRFTETFIQKATSMDLDDKIKEWTDKVTERVKGNLSSQLSNLIDEKLSFTNLLSKKENLNKDQVSRLVETKGPHYDSARKNIPFTLESVFPGKVV